MNRKAFTLIELLLVLIVVAVIAAFLFPLFARPHEHTQHHFCQSWEKQLGLALTQYVQDNDETFPVGPGGKNDGWAGKIYPYVKNEQVFHCQDDVTEPQGTQMPMSYALNRNLSLVPSFASLTHPAATVSLFEVQGTRADVTNIAEGVSPSGDGAALLTAGPGGHPTLALTRHQSGSSGGANYGLADGHVRWFPPSSVSFGANASRPDSPANGTMAAGAEVAGADKIPFKVTFSVR